MKLKSLTLSNFGSFGEQPQTILFPEGEILIIGDNQDSEGADSNGSGKTTILNAISWALFGDIAKDVSVDQVIRKGANQCSVQIQLQEKELAYFIHRERGIKETLTFAIHDNNTTKGIDYTRRTTSQTQEEILRYFHLDLKKYFTDYINTTYFSSATVKGFASKQTTNSERIQLLTRFLNLDRFDLAVLHCKEIKKSLEASLELVQSKINEVYSNLAQPHSDFETYSLAIDQELIELNKTKTEWLEYKTNLLEFQRQLNAIETLNLQIANLKLQKKQYDENKTKKQKLIEQINKEKLELDEIAGDMQGLEPPEFYGISIHDARQVEKEIYSNIESFKTTLSQIRSQLKIPLTCPACNSTLHYHNGVLETIDLDKLKTLEEETKITIDKLQINLTATSEKLKAIEDELTASKDLGFKYTNIQSKLDLLIQQETEIKLIEQDFESQISQFEIQIPKDINAEEIKNGLKDAEEQLEVINSESGRLRETKKNIIKWQAAIIEYSGETLKYSGDLKKYIFWINTFPAIKQIIIDNYLPIFETRVNYYLQFLNTSFSVSLQLEKQKKSGGVTQDFQIIVRDEHGTDRDYETYSEGEMRRIAICVGFALRDIAKTRQSLPFDFIKIDEIVDGLDETGIYEFFKLCRTLSDQKLIVSHNNSFKSLFSNVLEVTRKNGISKINLYANTPSQN